MIAVDRDRGRLPASSYYANLANLSDVRHVASSGGALILQITVRLILLIL